MSKDYTKLKNFVEAALTNPLHPVYRLGMQHSPILQSYALNVSLLGAIQPEQWFRDYPDKAAKLEEVMALCEEQEEATPVPAAGTDDLTALKAKVADLETKLAALTVEKPEAETADE